MLQSINPAQRREWCMTIAFRVLTAQIATFET
jgi:hypothetical protein